MALVGLIALRVGATLLMTPVLYAVAMPATVRMLAVLGLSLTLASGGPFVPYEWTGWGPFIGAAASELALGATLGLGILLAFGAFSVAGQMLDVQLGYGMAQLVDPLTSRPVPILTTVFERLGLLIFFLVNGHHALLRGLDYSLQRFPAGAPWSLVNAATPLLKQVSGLFTLGFALAAPVVLCVLLVEFALGVVSRNLPQINMFTMGIPVKILVGLMALSVWFTGIGATMSRAYASIASTWNSIFLVAQGR